MLQLKVLGDKRTDTGYAPSYGFEGPDLGPRHRESIAAVDDIPGWLQPEDVLKLYELAYFAPGSILEVGCFKGKSTIVIARALADRDTSVPFFSLDIDPEALVAAGAAIGKHSLSDRVVLLRGSVDACLRSVPNLRPWFVFIDGDHSRRGVRRDLAALRSRVPNGGVLLFHDYHDERNAESSQRDYGVVQAVSESWVARDCEFAGVFGCCGMFARQRGGPENGHAGDNSAPILDALPHEGMRMQYVQRVRRPLRRQARKLQRKLLPGAEASRETDPG